MDPHMTRIVLVRHGETDYNRRDRYMGRRQEGLNDLGRWQADRVAERLASEGEFDVLLSSPLRRTMETASPIGAALGLTTTAVPGFLEVDMGPWEGRDRAEVEAEDPGRWALWLTDPARVEVEGMEGVDALLARVGAALDETAARYPAQRIVVVTHYACVATAVLHALGLPSSAYRRFPVGNGSLTELRMGGLAKLVRFNDTAHLGDGWLEEDEE